jgi:hypothetical protein
METLESNLHERKQYEAPMVVYEAVLQVHAATTVTSPTVIPGADVFDSPSK